MSSSRFNESSVVALLSDLVAIDSINPDLVDGGAGEAEIAAFIARWLEDVGCEVHHEEVRPGRPNVIGIVRGTGGGKTLLLNGHIDTVGVAGMAREASQPSVRNGRLYGPGAYDMKAGIAACTVGLREAGQSSRQWDRLRSCALDC